MIAETSTKAKPVDVICQHSRDGSLTPIKIRIVDEDGVFQEYKIKGYRERSHQGTRMMPDGVYVTDKTFIFECNIEVFGHNKMIRLYYEPNSTIWKMTAWEGKMDDKLKNNRLSDDDLDKVNGGTGYSPTSPEAAMIFKGECPECYKRSRGTELGELIDRGGFYMCKLCGSDLYISF